MSESKDLNSNHSYVPVLTPLNYGKWSEPMEAFLAVKGLWGHVSGDETIPLPADQSTGIRTKAEQAELKLFAKEHAQAAGYLFLYIDDSQKAHVRNVRTDPKAVWDKLKAVHLQQKPSSRFTSIDQLFSLEKENSETLTTLMGRVSKHVQDLRSLLPTAYTLEMLLGEIEIMAMLRALPPAISI